ncbi:hypothetical protein C8F04DRAFT_1233202 [Mycena alexandri]|uniref:Uncharacterized protein n=1 Tax=Mycena alexandri TaxID=1745969 RepID=A0AAD6X5G6_9AGAR|nr:hypothetical protein C8F04DRAFT_1233202 [Mycena alexandri]
MRLTRRPEQRPRGPLTRNQGKLAVNPRSRFEAVEVPKQVIETEIEGSRRASEALEKSKKQANELKGKIAAASVEESRRGQSLPVSWFREPKTALARTKYRLRSGMLIINGLAAKLRKDEAKDIEAHLGKVVMMEAKRNERPNGPMTGNDFSRQDQRRSSSSSLFVPDPCPPRARAANSASSSTLATAVTTILVPGLACSRAVSLSALPAPRRRPPTATMATVEHPLSLPQRILELVNPRANDEFHSVAKEKDLFTLPRCTTSCVIVRAATSRTSLARALTQRSHADAAKKPPTPPRLRTSTTGAG